ncbi:MAG: SH3 domain-containing protein [Myxococcota bacterium]
MNAPFVNKRVLMWMLVGMLPMALGCGGKAKPGEPCKTQSDCERGAICFEQKCEAPNAAEKVSKAAEADGAPDKAEGSDAASETWEVFRVARDKKEPWLYVREKRTSKAKHVGKLKEGTTVKVLATEGKWRNITITSGEYKGKTGWAHICCMKPKGSQDLYWARLGAEDHSNNSGRPIESAAGIIRQDRANYHAFKLRDKRDDRTDDTYDDKAKREWLATTLKDSLDKETKRIIYKHQPLVEVVTWEDRVDVTVIEKGPKHEMMWEEADALCGRRYCKCITGKGKCKDKKYKACMKNRGHRMNVGCERAH